MTFLVVQAQVNRTIWQVKSPTIWTMAGWVLRISIKKVSERLKRLRRSTGDAGVRAASRERFVISR
jgi:hypothetical protein